MKLHQSKLGVIYHGLSVWLTGMAWYSNCLPRVFPLLFRKIIFTFTRHDRHSKFSRHFFYILEQERKYKMLWKTNSKISSVRNFLSEVNMLKVKVYFWSGCKYCQNWCEYWVLGRWIVAPFRYVLLIHKIVLKIKCLPCLQRCWDDRKFVPREAWTEQIWQEGIFSRINNFTSVF